MSSDSDLWSVEVKCHKGHESSVPSCLLGVTTLCEDLFVKCNR